MGIEIVGYTSSGGYALCPEHADYGQRADENNETGFVFPIFVTDETGSDITCDVDHTVLLAKNILDE
jgi:hypothetical protein